MIIESGDPLGSRAAARKNPGQNRYSAANGRRRNNPSRDGTVSLACSTDATRL